MENHPFFFTWAKQTNPVKIEFESNGDHFFILKNGSSVFDLSSISFQASFGLSNETIKKAISKQLESFSVISPKAVFPLKTKASIKLLSLLEGNEATTQKGKIFYTLSGAESVENALKMARQIKKKKIILSRQKSYHGFPRRPSTPDTTRPADRNSQLVDSNRIHLRNARRMRVSRPA